MGRRGPNAGADPITRLLERVEIDPVTECWIWQGAKTSSGYGAMSVGGKFTAVHKLAYAMANECPKGARIWHTCSSRLCCNPEHMRNTVDNGPRRSEPGTDPITRLLSRIEIDPETECWIWQGAKNRRGGYGRITADGKLAYTHRFAYEQLVGPIPSGLQIDHLCRNPPCCNPEHLEPVTPFENTRRGKGNGRKTHCPKGHPYSGDNLYVTPERRRACRECNRKYQRRWHARKRAERQSAENAATTTQ